MLTASCCPATAKGRLVRVPARLARERNREHAADEPADDGFQRDRLAEGDEVALAIELGRGRSDGHHAVVVTRCRRRRQRRFRREHPDQHVAVARHDGAEMRRSTASGTSSANTGNALSGSTTSRPRLRGDEVGVEVERPRPEIGVELEVLRDVALNERNGDRSAGRRTSIRRATAPRRRRRSRLPRRRALRRASVRRRRAHRSPAQRRPRRARSRASRETRRRAARSRRAASGGPPGNDA